MKKNNDDYSDKKLKGAVYIPGWMDRAKFYPFFKGLEIWEKDIDPKKRIKADYLVAHSLGTHFALLNWESNRDTKLVLINPLIVKKSMKEWFSLWMRFFASEGRSKVNSSRLSLLSHLKLIYRKTKHLFSRDFMEIMEKVPPEDLTVIWGTKDYFFCNKGLVRLLRKKGIKVVEVKGMGHIWNEDGLKAIKDIIGME